MSVMQQYIDQQAAKPPARTVRDYTDEEIHHGLVALVACAGSPLAASKLLAERHIDISQSTLSSWKRTRSDELDALREEWAPKLEAEMIRHLRETAVYAAEVERKAVEAAERRLDENKDVNPHQTAVSMAKVKATATDKLQLLLGRPQTITEHRTVEELTRSLVALNVIELVIDEPVKEPEAMTLVCADDE